MSNTTPKKRMEKSVMHDAEDNGGEKCADLRFCFRHVYQPILLTFLCFSPLPYTISVVENLCGL